MGEDGFWDHAGVSGIRENRGSYRVRIPDRVFREKEGEPVEILPLNTEITWSLQMSTGVIVASNEELEKDEYVFVKETSFSEGDSEYEATMPREFFPGYQGRGGPTAAPDFVERIQLEADERLHFMYHEGMAEGEVRSCFIFTEEQFLDRFADSDLWEGSLSDVPQFLS